MEADHTTPETGLRTNLHGSAWCFALTWLALMVSGPSGQPYDAFDYTNGPLEILSGTMGPDGFAPRGALTSVIYLPAAIGTKVGVSLITGVLVQNAALLAALGAFVLPALVSVAGVRVRAQVIWCCALVVVIFGRFAPTGLMDLWAMSAVLLAVLLVARPTALRVLAAGTLVGAAVNRPFPVERG